MLGASLVTSFLAGEQETRLRSGLVTPSPLQPLGHSAEPPRRLQGLRGQSCTTALETDRPATWKALFEPKNTSDGSASIGRSAAHGCACRFCGGVATAHRPHDSSGGGGDVPLCFPASLHAEHVKPWQDGFGVERCGYGPGWSQAASRFDECLGAPEPRAAPRRRVFLVGDSHAQNLLPALTAAVRGTAVVRAMTAPGRGLCGAPASVDAVGAEYRHRVLATLARDLRPGDVIVAHNYLGGELCGDVEAAATFYEQHLVGPLAARRNATLLLFSDWSLLGCEASGEECVRPDTAKDDRAEARRRHQAPSASALPPQRPSRPGATLLYATTASPRRRRATATASGSSAPRSPSPSTCARTRCRRSRRATARASSTSTCTASLSTPPRGGAA